MEAKWNAAEAEVLEQVDPRLADPEALRKFLLEEEEGDEGDFVGMSN